MVNSVTESWTYWKHNPISFRGWVVSSVVKVELWVYSETLLFVNMYLKFELKHCCYLTVTVNCFCGLFISGLVHRPPPLLFGDERVDTGMVGAQPFSAYLERLSFALRHTM